MEAVLSALLAYFVQSPAMGMVDSSVSANASLTIPTGTLLIQSSAIAALIPSAIFVAISQVVRQSRATSNWNTFGHVSTDDFLDLKLPDYKDSIIPAVLVVNSPQVVISFLYMLYNGLFTCMLAGREWSQYAVKRATLRGMCPSA
jgi:hypothetical protein